MNAPAAPAVSEGTRIRPATPGDAPDIARAIMMALGDEMCAGFVSEGNTLDDVARLFAICAASDDSQYSWRNTLVAVGPEGETRGLLVSYDGARLDELRRRFLDEFTAMHGYRIDSYMTEETTPDEFYIDSLAVFPEYRGRGIAGALIAAAAGRARRECGKPLGLLVDKTNHRARGLYNRLGFVPDGERAFAGELMDHLVLR